MNLLRRSNVTPLLLWLLGLVLLYVLSVGPVIKYTAARGPGGLSRLPRWVRIAYYPVLNSGVPIVNDVLDRYVQLWLEPD